MTGGGVDILYSGSIYDPRRPWMSKEKTDDFRFPCVWSISKVDGSMKFRYSSEDKGHFGVPKVIFGVWHSSGIPYADHEGKYGMTQHAAAVVDDPSNLDLIAAALDSNEFREIMRSVQFTTEGWNRNVISLFRKDFWKEFV